jgi:hypothetical protein
LRTETPAWAEQIRRHEVSRIFEKMVFSPEKKQAIERLSYSLVAKLILGPISEVTVRTEICASHVERSVDRAVSTSE